MKPIETHRHGMLTRGLITLAALGLAGLAFAAPVEAKSKQHRRGDSRARVEQRHDRHDRFERHDRRGRHEVRRHQEFRRGRHDHHERRRFVVPRAIHRHERRQFLRYGYGESWFAPHRHSHAVYYFPVQRRHGWIYEPHFYCGDRLFVGNHVHFAGPRVRFSIDF